MKRLALFVGVLAIAVPAVAQDASGTWQLTVTTTQREPRTASMSLKKDGDKLSGSFVGPQGNEVAVSGTQLGAEVTLSFTFPTQDGPVAVSLKGRQEGESMKGAVQIAGEDRGQWTAARTATPAETPAGTSAIDLTGTWAFQVVTEAGTRTPTVVLKQEGEQLTGRYKSQLGEAAVTGKVKDRNFTFQVTLPLDATPITITYVGTVDEKGVSGRVSVGDADAGTFTGKKQDSGAQ